MCCGWRIPSARPSGRVSASRAGSGPPLGDESGAARRLGTDGRTGRGLSLLMRSSSSDATASHREGLGDRSPAGELRAAGGESSVCSAFEERERLAVAQARHRGACRARGTALPHAAGECEGDAVGIRRVARGQATAERVDAGSRTSRRRSIAPGSACCAPPRPSTRRRGEPPSVQLAERAAQARRSAGNALGDDGGAAPVRRGARAGARRARGGGPARRSRHAAAAPWEPSARARRRAGRAACASTGVCRGAA